MPSCSASSPRSLHSALQELPWQGLHQTAPAARPWLEPGHLHLQDVLRSALSDPSPSDQQDILGAIQENNLRSCFSALTQSA